jgi:PBP1b-binding outer membrane lipoprotein LpoB
MKSLLAATFIAVLAAGCASTEPPAKEAMGKVAARAIECDMTATRIKPRECNANTTAMSKDDMLEHERRAQQVQIPLPR